MNQSNSCNCHQNQCHPPCCERGPAGPKGDQGPAGPDIVQAGEVRHGVPSLENGCPVGPGPLTGPRRDRFCQCSRAPRMAPRAPVFCRANTSAPARMEPAMVEIRKGAT